MFRIFKYMRWHDVLLILGIAGLVTLQVWLELKMPEYMGEITGELTSYGTPAMDKVWINGGWMLGCAVGTLIAAVVTTFLATRLSGGFAARLRYKMFEKVESFSAAEINKFSTASLVTRTTNDVSQVQMLTGMGTHLLIKAPVMSIWALTKIASSRWQFLALTGGAVLALLILVVFLILVALPKFRRIQSLTDNLNRLTRENLTGIRVIRAYGAEEFREEQFEKANDDMTKTQLFANRALQVMQPVMMLVLSVLSLGISTIGAYLFSKGGTIVEQAEMLVSMLTLSQYAVQILISFVMLVMVFIIAPRAAVSAKRILEVLNTEPSVKDGDGAEPAEGEEGTVEFRRVSFKYPDAEEYVLENISFRADKGETVAFIGSTGSGKSTLINLVPRFYDASEGQVLVDGVDVKQYKVARLNDKLGYIPQKGVLFSGDIRDNVAYGEPQTEITEEDIIKAIEISQAKEFTDGLEGGLNAPVARGGTNLSGGQKQRLSIARALAKKPEILIFDDSFSALDYKTDKLLRGALKKHLSNTTNLIVAQRIGTIQDADKIVVLDNGKAVGIGTHKELMESCAVYREIALSQLSKEELENVG